MKKGSKVWLKHHRKYTRRHYDENKEQYLARNRRRRVVARALIVELKSRPCVDCTTQYPFYVMEFDHVRGKKLFTLASAHTQALERIRREAEKCDVVCANCHAIRTWKRSHLAEAEADQHQAPNLEAPSSNLGGETKEQWS